MNCESHTMEKSNQVNDDLELLELMLADTKLASELYRPSNYWAEYEKKFIPELKRIGLRDFRRRENSVLSSFSATELAHNLGQINLVKSRLLNNKIVRRIPHWSKFVGLLNTVLNKALPIKGTYSISDFERLLFDYACLQGEKSGAKPLTDLDASLIGNPRQVLHFEDSAYTMPILTFYLQYAYCSKFINFDNLTTIVELGSGSGKQIEVIKKLHPNISYLLFDIPPQLYICEQYLQSVFPGDVVSYRDTRELKSISNIQPGKIYIFGNWKFPIIDEIDLDLFWNAASFQEMEPDIVANYLKYVNKSAKTAFLLEVMQGKEIASRPGEHGVLKQTTLDNYIAGLPDFSIKDMSPPYWPINKRHVYSNSFWCRKKEQQIAK